MIAMTRVNLQTEAGPARIKTVLRFIKEYKDDIYIELEEKL